MSLFHFFPKRPRRLHPNGAPAEEGAESPQGPDIPLAALGVGKEDGKTVYLFFCVCLVVFFLFKITFFKP